jgi:hypothetical protein
MINPAITTALLAAGQDKHSKEFIASKLREAKALGSSTAIALDLDEKQRKLLDQAIADGSVVKTLDGRFYLNERAVSERNEGQGFMALLIVLVIGSIIASLAVLVSRAGG